MKRVTSRFSLYHPTFDCTYYCSSWGMELSTKIPDRKNFQRRMFRDCFSSPNKNQHELDRIHAMSISAINNRLGLELGLGLGQDSMMGSSRDTGLTMHNISMSCRRSPYPRRFMNFCTNSQFAALLAGLFPRLNSSLSSFPGW